MINPGKTEKLAITLSCHKLKREFTRNVVVLTSDPDNAKVTLVCKGKILEPIILEPQYLSFGTLSSKAGPQHKTLELKRGDGGPIKPKLGEVKIPGFESKLEEVKPGEHYRLEATLNPPFERLRVLPNAKLETGVADAPSVDLRIRYRLAPRVRAEPHNLRLPATLKKDWERTIRLVWDDEASHSITGATANDPEIKLEVKDEGEEQVVVAHMDAVAEVPRMRRLIKVSTDDAAAPTVNVPVVVGRVPMSRRKAGAGRRPVGVKVPAARPGDSGKDGKTAAPVRPRAGKVVD